MYIDICFPKGNENEFVEIAKKIGTKALVLVYKDYKELIKQKNLKLNYNTYLGLLSNIKVREKQEIGVDIILSTSVTRRDIENKIINLQYNFENISKKDKIHFRSSGINQVIGKIIKQKKKIVGISVTNLWKGNTAKKLGRIIQNLKILTKYDVDYFLASFAENPIELSSMSNIISMSRTLGIKDKEIKKSINVLWKFLNKKK